MTELCSDNMAVETVVNTGSSRDKAMMQLMRTLFFIVTHFNVQLRTVHVRGATNVAADAMSRNDLPRFLQVVPGAVPYQTPIPKGLVDLLVREQPDWTSARWAQLFSDCYRQA